MTDKIKIIDDALLKEWGACEDGLKRFNELFPDGADLETAINGLVKDDHDEWGYWLFTRCQERKLFTDFVMKGYRNIGIENTGDRNSGDMNTGDTNTGNWNSGNWNSGNWNSGNWNAGYFNTVTPSNFLVFNEPCEREAWEKAYKPHFLAFNLTYWVDKSAMTDEEKAANPGSVIRGGQIRERDYKEAFKLSWDNADPEDRMRVKDLPNFDAEIFYQISGIDLRKSNGS